MHGFGDFLLVCATLCYYEAISYIRIIQHSKIMTSSTTLWNLLIKVVCIVFFWEAWGWLVINKQIFSLELRYYHLQNVVGHVGFQIQMLSIERSSETFQSKYCTEGLKYGKRASVILKRMGKSHIFKVTLCMNMYQDETGHFILHTRLVPVFNSISSHFLYRPDYWYQWKIWYE